MTGAIATSPEAGADFGMTDLEESLKGPDGPTVRRDALERLDGMSRRLDRELGGGAPPDLFDRLQAMRLAVATASRILTVDQPRTASQGEN